MMTVRGDVTVASELRVEKAEHRLGCDAPVGHNALNFYL